MNLLYFIRLQRKIQSFKKRLDRNSIILMKNHF